jgi:hypothetical protein
MPSEIQGLSRQELWYLTDSQAPRAPHGRTANVCAYHNPAGQEDWTVVQSYHRLLRCNTNNKNLRFNANMAPALVEPGRDERKRSH